MVQASHDTMASKLVENSSYDSPKIAISSPTKHNI